MLVFRQQCAGHDDPFKMAANVQHTAGYHSESRIITLILIIKVYYIVIISDNFHKEITVQKLTPFLWFNDNAEEAVNFLYPHFLKI
jgi:hypothetical protein